MSAREIGEASFFVYCFKRLVYSALLVFLAITVIFGLVHLAPGDPLTALVGDFPVPEEYEREIRKAYGLDKSLPEQLVAYLTRVLKGDLGYSFKNRKPVLSLLWERGKNTALLTVSALILAVILGIPLGVFAALKRLSATDTFVTVLAAGGYAVPVFWLGQILLIIFAVKFALFPAQGMTAIRVSYTGIYFAFDVAHHLLLPAAVLSLRYIAIIARVTRASMVEVQSKEYITTARAKGLPDHIVVWKHAIKNALLPVVTIIGFQAGLLLSGSALVETVFGWPGIGRLLYDSINARDYPVIQGVFITVTLCVVAANWITDSIYGLLDPRIRNR